ncbi:UNVERIFIED_CONTAM: hypothetical protein Sradi_0936700 [Sesamum radiatum]|uniref:DUF4283 domain-containing protein n=1 Tax=Sesamum radiatum TaxID=300843 RepID=A0AAW2V513_SESRA
MAKGKKGKQHKATNTTSQHSSLASIDAKAFEEELATAAEQKNNRPAETVCPEVGSKTDGQPVPDTAPFSAKMSTNGTEVGNNDFQSFLSGLESSPLFAAKAKHGSRPKNALPTKNMPSATATAGGKLNIPAIAPVLTEKLDQGQRPKGTQPVKETKPVYETLPASEPTAGAEGKAKSFAGLFSSNRKLSDENKLTKFAVEPETLELGVDDLIDVRTKLGYCLVGYIAGKFPGLQAIRTLSKTWGSMFQLHDSGWLIFRFQKDDDRQRVLAGGPYFVYGRPLILKVMPDCFEFKEDSISLTPVWATLPSLPLECWHANALGKIGSKLGMPIAMDSLTLKMERVSYARILVEVDASKPLVDQVDFMLPNGMMRSQPVVYEFIPKFCTKCNRFGHLVASCQGTQPPTDGTAKPTALTATEVLPEKKKSQPTEWTVVKRKPQKQQQAGKGHLAGKGVQGQSAPLADKDTKERSVHKAQSSGKNQPGSSKPQQNAIASAQKAGLRTQSSIESLGSSDETDSQTSTQHLMPGTSSADVAQTKPKSRQETGGEYLPPST